MQEQLQGIIELINLEQLAEKLGVKKSWVYQRTRTKQIPSYRIGKYLKFNETEVMDWVKNMQDGN
jgi:excisionase family DNA binding protein